MTALSPGQYEELVDRALNDPSGPLCVLCRRRHRKNDGPKPKPMPKWAKGEQFAGWTWNPRDETIYRTTAMEFVAITEDGGLLVTNYSDDYGAEYEFAAPEEALVVANAIASVRGGWRHWDEESEEFK